MGRLSNLGMAIEIRPAQSWADYLACEEVQRQVWAAPDNRDVVPASLLITAHKNGGILLGAFDQGQMVAFVFGFIGSEGEGTTRIKHCSHMLAVLPAYRGTGLGIALKQGQREILLTQGLKLATWTYDPLQALNAQLNLSRLGAIARRYVRDAYGEMYDVLNAGVSSDRFEAEWWITSDRVRERMAAPRQAAQIPSIPAVFDVQFEANGLVRALGERDWQGDRLWLEIPVDFNRMKELDLDLARAWRESTRNAFEKLFKMGYVAIEAHVDTSQVEPARAGYVLAQASNLNLGFNDFWPIPRIV